MMVVVVSYLFLLSCRAKNGDSTYGGARWMILSDETYKILLKTRGDCSLRSQNSRPRVRSRSESVRITGKMAYKYEYSYLKTKIFKSKVLQKEATFTTFKHNHRVQRSAHSI